MTGTTTAWTTVTRPQPSAVSLPPLSNNCRAACGESWAPPLSLTPELLTPQISTPAPRTGSSARTTGASPTAGSVTGTTTVGTVKTSPMPLVQVWVGVGCTGHPSGREAGAGRGSQSGLRKERSMGY